jgi:hypothetical protein
MVGMSQKQLEETISELQFFFVALKGTLSPNFNIFQEKKLQLKNSEEVEHAQKGEIPGFNIRNIVRIHFAPFIF